VLGTSLLAPEIADLATDYKKAIASLNAARTLDKEQYGNLATLRILSSQFYLKDRKALTDEVAEQVTAGRDRVFFTGSGSGFLGPLVGGGRAVPRWRRRAGWRAKRVCSRECQPVAPCGLHCKSALKCATP
jgi:hypothetical protein